MTKRSLFMITLLTAAVLIISGCSASGSKLDPDDPVTLTMWHVYGEQAESPMNILVDEFNETAGREKGININVTSVTNSSSVQNELTAAFNEEPGAQAMPDLFFCHPNNALALGVENLVDWNDLFSSSEMDEYVQDFVRAGTLDDRLTVFPVSKSTFLMFINDNEFHRFSKATGHTYDDLATWKGFYKAAEDYTEWSGGKAFCAFDFPLSTIPIYATGQDPDENYDENWLDFSDRELKKAWMDFSMSLARGNVLFADLFSNTQVMTGEVAAGIGSSAAILYYNDSITHPDNTTEDLDLKVLPVPQAPGEEHYAQQAGVGLCALKTDDRKAEASYEFAKWLTDSDRNLDFVTGAGYIPVKKDAYEKLEDYEFMNKAYSEVYSAISETRADCTFVSEKKSDADYYQHIDRVYKVFRPLQHEYQRRYEDGEKAGDIAKDSWQRLSSIE